MRANTVAVGAADGLLLHLFFAHPGDDDDVVGFVLGGIEGEGGGGGATCDGVDGGGVDYRGGVVGGVCLVGACQIVFVSLGLVDDAPECG